MKSCEDCMLLEDLYDIGSRNLYMATLGFVFDTGPFLVAVPVVPKSKLERYKRGDYGLKVLEAEQLSSTSSKTEIMHRMATKYGVSVADNNVNMAHEERVRVANEIANKLIQISYVNSVYLTGSTALDLDRSDSDIDLLVVLGYCPGNNRHVEMDELTGSHPVDLFYVQQRVFSSSQSLQYPFIRGVNLILSK